MKDVSMMESKNEVEKNLDICVEFWQNKHPNDHEKFIDSLDSDCINQLLDRWLELDSR
jgi:hypothetical protein